MYSRSVLVDRRFSCSHDPGQPRGLTARDSLNTQQVTSPSCSSSSKERQHTIECGNAPFLTHWQDPGNEPRVKHVELSSLRIPSQYKSVQDKCYNIFIVELIRSLTSKVSRPRPNTPAIPDLQFKPNTLLLADPSKCQRNAVQHSRCTL